MFFCSAIPKLRSVAATVAVAFFFASFSISALAESKPPEVFFGGFAFSGRVDDVGKSFPISSSINTPTDDGTPFLGRQAREFFKKHQNQFNRIKLQFGVARSEDTSLVMALALTDEKILKEEFSDFNKLVISLGFELIILNFKDQEVVCSQPIYLEFIDAGKGAFDDSMLRKRVREMIEGDNSQLFSAILDKANNVQPRSKNQSTLQIRNISLGEKALPFLPETLQRTPRAYSQTIAQQFGSLLCMKAGLALLPFAKDGLNTKMALVFSDASSLQFRIPPSTFAIDLEVKGFKKVLDNKTDAEALWIYGAFAAIRIYEPEFNTVFFDSVVKHGVTKVVPTTQKSVDEFPIVSEALKGALLSGIDQIQKDKKTTEKVLNKCKL
jgi:hypothetical protein